MKKIVGVWWPGPVLYTSYSLSVIRNIYLKNIFHPYIKILPHYNIYYIINFYKNPIHRPSHNPKKIKMSTSLSGNWFISGSRPTSHITPFQARRSRASIWIPEGDSLWARSRRPVSRSGPYGHMALRAGPWVDARREVSSI